MSSSYNNVLLSTLDENYMEREGAYKRGVLIREGMLIKVGVIIKGVLLREGILI